MKNVYDIKHEKGLNYILPLDKKLMGSAVTKKSFKALVVIHLYYLDTVEFFLRYVENIPDDMDIIFTVSEDRVKKAIQGSEHCKNKQYKIIYKQNRGRDISAFLVAARNEILKYEYVCFLHDKKEKTVSLRSDVENWNKCLWENMIGSDNYIDNILALFYENPNLGLVVPPFPLSEHIYYLHTNMWVNNFSITKKLADKMKLCCNLETEKSPITLGTVFWAKVSALKKLFEIDWKYSDFDEEPLKDDGTLSHAIERILAYVAQDAGFDTGWVMNDKYASEQFEYTRLVLKKAFERLGKSLDIWHIADLDRYEDRLKKLLEFVDNYECIYIYGAGVVGKKYATFLTNRQKRPEAFLVSDKSRKVSEIQGIPVYSISEIELNEQCGIIIGVGEQYQREVLETIKEKKPLFYNLYLYQRV